MPLRHGWLLILLGCACASFPVSAAIEHARVEGGRIKGRVSGEIASFKGIPFAASPIGDLRWKVPQPVRPWNGVRDASEFATPCIQYWNGTGNKPDEDCLYLNVWTGAASRRERRPVIVWIHGGGLTGGSSADPVSDGSHLAREGAVVVTTAYRLGALGFLAHAGLTREHGAASGNYGLHDIVAALKWVRANIAQFGGDPQRVTIMGGSAGAFSISLLSASPLAGGLYSRAAAFGGTAIFPASSTDPDAPYFSPTLSFGESQGEALFRHLGAKTLAAARAIPAMEFVRAVDEAKVRIGTIEDGLLIQGAARARFEAGLFNDTPLLVGYNSDEAGDPGPKVTAASANADLDNAPCKPTHAAFEAAYPSFTTDEEARAVVRQANRDGNLGWSTWEWARLQSTKGGHPVYATFFDVHRPDQPHGAPHATEYAFLFGNLPAAAPRSDLAISKLLRGYLINFATRADPNGAGLPRWERFDSTSNRAMVIDERPGSREWPGLAGIKAFDAFYRCAYAEAGAR